MRRAARPLADHWQRVPVQPRGSTQLGISFRPLQAAALRGDRVGVAVPVTTASDSIESAMKMIEGSARSMGLQVVES